MANCLDRKEGQGIPRDEFFMHNKSSSVMGSSPLCISALGNATVLTEKCKDSLRNQNDVSECDKLIKNDLKKSDDLEITSGFILLNQECTESNPFKVCQSTLSNRLKAGDLTLKSVPRDSTANPSLYTDKSDSFTLSISPVEPNRTCSDEKSGKLPSDKTDTNVKSTSNDFQSDRNEQVILLSDDSNCSAARTVSDEVKNIGLVKNEKSDLIQINSDSESSEAMTKLTYISSSEINLPSTEDCIEVSGDESIEKEMTESFSVTANSDQDFDNSNSCQLASDEQMETCSNVSKNINMEDIRMDDTADSDKSKSTDEPETVSALAHLKSEIIDVKPDIIDLSMYSDDDSGDYTANSPAYEARHIKQEIIETVSNDGVYYTESIAKDDSNTEDEFPNQDSFDSHSFKIEEHSSNKDVISNFEQNERNIISQNFKGILMNAMKNDKLSKEVFKRSETEIGPLEAAPMEVVLTNPDLVESDFKAVVPIKPVSTEPGLMESVSEETVLMEPVIMKPVSIEAISIEQDLIEPDLESVSMEPVLKESVSMETGPKESVTIERGLKESVPIETGPKESVSMESIPMKSVSKETVPKESVSMEIVQKESMFLDTVSKELVSIERVSMEAVSSVDKPEKSHPVKLKNSKCTIQLVPKGHGKLLGERRRNCLNAEDNNWNNDSESGLAERLETLTGTVKIGCLSVTPLLPCTKNETKEQVLEESESKTKVTDNIVDITDDLKKEHGTNKDSSDKKRTINIFLKNENLLKNNVDLTISPKDSESGVDALETLKVKIPQLIESFTSNAPSEKSPSTMQEPNKNFIVNKNLKIIESFLMQKGFQKEANILKEKTEIIKPYLEDIALKMEKTINERRSALIRSDVKESSTTEFNKIMNDYSRRCETGKTDRAADKELSALTEKFLHSSVARPKRYEDYLAQVFYPSGHPSTAEKTRMYDRYYGKSYYEGLDYLTSRDQGGYAGRGMEPCMNKVYKSSRHDVRESDYYSGIPDMSMYDQFLPEFDNKMHPNTLVGKSNAFSHSDFSQFIDEYTAEKYNNFIHFMVPDMEALAFDMMESRMWKESELNHAASNPPMNCCMPMSSPVPQFYPNGPYQYPMMPHSPMQMIPPSHIPSHPVHHPMNPAMGRHMMGDSSKENCGLTITPLDECGKPYGPMPLLSEPCTQGYCNEPYPCSQSFPPGILPPIPPLVPADALSQQLTITPLHQSSNLPYLHRSADSASRRRGRPPLDPEYAAVGFRKDAYANARFSRADFMARVQNNIDPSCFDLRYMRFGKIPSDIGGMESQPVESIKQGVSISSVAETEVLPPPMVLPVAVLPTITPPINETAVSAPPVVMKIGETPVKSPIPVNSSIPLNPPIPVNPPMPILTSVSSLAPAPGTAILLSNGFKRMEPRLEKPKPRFVEIAPRPTAIPEPVVLKPKPPFQVSSKQVKIDPEKLLTGSSVKISLVDKRPPIPDTSSKTPMVSITKTNCREERITTSEKITPSKKVTPEKNITHDKITSSENIITCIKNTPEKNITHENTTHKGMTPEKIRTHRGMSSEKIRTHKGMTPEKIRTHKGMTPEKIRTHKGMTPEKIRAHKEGTTDKIFSEKVTSEKTMNPKRQITDNLGSNSELSEMCKNIREKHLATPFKNTMITLKAAQVSSCLIKKDNSVLKIEKTNNESKIESEISLDSKNINKAVKISANRAVNNKISSDSSGASATQIKQIEFENSSSNSIIIIDSETDKTLDSDELGFTKNLPVKPKKRRRIPQFKKKKKRGKPKNPTEIQNKVVKPRKVVVEKPIVKTNEKSNSSNLNVPKFNEENSLSNSNSCCSTNNKESGMSESMESPDQSADGVRRSGRKRKIIEGNPKFRDMERVDLKYFREERIKSTPTKRKSDPKVGKPEIVVKKQKKIATKEPIKIEKHIKTINPSNKSINSVIKTINPIKTIKTINPINRNNEKIGSPNESNTKEKLQQFLDVNDIYLKPQTFV